MIEPLVFRSSSSEETENIGKTIASFLHPKDIVFLSGDLGAGKTTLMKGVSSEWTGTNPAEITSPTFTYLHIYGEEKKVYHFDLYRLSSPSDFFSMGFHEFLSSNGICCIEWPDRLPENFPYAKVCIDISYDELDKRLITLRRMDALI